MKNKKGINSNKRILSGKEPQKYTFKEEGHPNETSFPEVPSQTEAYNNAHEYAEKKGGYLDLTEKQRKKYDDMVLAYNPYLKAIHNLSKNDERIRRSLNNYYYNLFVDSDDPNKTAYSPYNATEVSGDKDINEAKDFLFNWYNDPATKKIVEKAVENIPAGPHVSDRIIAKVTGLEPKPKKDPMTFRLETPGNYADDPYYLAVLNGLQATPFAMDVQPYYDSMPGGNGEKVSGIYDPNYNNVAIDNSELGSKGELTTWVHEYNHALQNMLGLYQNGNSKPYTQRPREIHSALMALRKQFGLSPSKRDYTAADAKRMLKEMKKFVGFNEGPYAGLAKYAPPRQQPPLSETPQAVWFFLHGMNDGHGIRPEQLAHYLNTMADANDVVDNSMEALPEEAKVAIPVDSEEGVYSAANGGKLHKFSGLEAINKHAGESWDNATSSENLTSTIGGLMGGISNIVEASMANAKVDTSKADNAIAAINSYTPDNSNLDSIGSGYNALKFDNDINASDMTVSTGEGLANMGKAGLTGAMEGFKVGGLWGGIAGLAGGLASSGFSWLGATLDAEDEAEIKRKEEAIAEIGAQNKGIAATDSYFKNKHYDFMSNLASYGGPIHKHSGDWSNKEYLEGCEYDLDEAEINKLLNLGYKIEYV